MKKDFDLWNERKKMIEENIQNKFYHPRDIWWCSLGVNIGFEQDGTGEENERPVLVLRGFSRQVCLIVPLTTSIKKNPYHEPVGNIDGKEAFAIISQVRLIDTKRLKNKISMLDEARFGLIRKAVKELL